MFIPQSCSEVGLSLYHNNPSGARFTPENLHFYNKSILGYHVEIKFKLEIINSALKTLQLCERERGGGGSL